MLLVYRNRAVRRWQHLPLITTSMEALAAPALFRATQTILLMDVESVTSFSGERTDTVLDPVVLVISPLRSEVPVSVTATQEILAAGLAVAVQV